jgi:hypothetical protein
VAYWSNIIQKAHNVIKEAYILCDEVGIRHTRTAWSGGHISL